jgi:hypothetical protein
MTARLVKVASEIAETTYQVVVDGVVIGEVSSHRTESWRQLPSGVRYSLRGRPLHWEAEAVGWLPADARHDLDRRIGYRFARRGAAVLVLLHERARATNRLFCGHDSTNLIRCHCGTEFCDVCPPHDCDDPLDPEP